MTQLSDTPASRRRWAPHFHVMRRHDAATVAVAPTLVAGAIRRPTSRRLLTPLVSPAFFFAIKPVPMLAHDTPVCFTIVPTFRYVGAATPPSPHQPPPPPFSPPTTVPIPTTLAPVSVLPHLLPSPLPPQKNSLLFCFSLPGMLTLPQRLNVPHTPFYPLPPPPPLPPQRDQPFRQAELHGSGAVAAFYHSDGDQSGKFGDKRRRYSFSRPARLFAGPVQYAAERKGMDVALLREGGVR